MNPVTRPAPEIKDATLGECLTPGPLVGCWWHVLQLVESFLCNVAHMLTLLLCLGARADAINIDGTLIHFLELYLLMQKVEA